MIFLKFDEEIKLNYDHTQAAVQEKEDYLKFALHDRQQLENSTKHISHWLKGASSLLDSGYDGLDYDTLDGTLSSFTVSYLKTLKPPNSPRWKKYLIVKKKNFFQLN